MRFLFMMAGLLLIARSSAFGSTQLPDSFCSPELCCQKEVGGYSSIYVGGSYTYGKSTYPQYFLQNLYDMYVRNPEMVQRDASYNITKLYIQNLALVAATT